MYATCPTHLCFRFDDHNDILCILHHPLVTFSQLGRSRLLSILFPYTFVLYFTVYLEGHISHPYRITVKLVGLFVYFNVQVSKYETGR
jgi:hypothetical protein